MRSEEFWRIPRVQNYAHSSYKWKHCQRDGWKVIDARRAHPHPKERLTLHLFKHAVNWPNLATNII